MEGFVDEEIESKVESMKWLIAQSLPHSKVLDGDFLQRFLYARDLNVEKASEMYCKYVKWKQYFVPSGYISETSITEQLKKNMILMQGFDKKGRPIIIVDPARHKPCSKTLEDLKRLFVYSFDKLSARAPGGRAKFSIIADLTNWGYRNVDIRGYLSIIEILQDYYPEHLGKLYITHVSYIFWAVWKIVSPFIDRSTREKIVIIEDKKTKDILLKDIDEDNLPETYGGKLTLFPIQDVAVIGWPSGSKMNDVEKYDSTTSGCSEESR